MGNVKKAGEILSVLFREQFDPNTLENARITAGLFSSWAVAAKKIDLPAAADHCRIRDLDRGILTIEAEHPGWVQLLHTKQNQLLDYFQKKYPELDIQGVSFFLSRETISPPEKPDAGKNAPVDQAARSGVPEPPVTENKNLHEPIKELRRALQKRNRGIREQ